MMERSYQVQDPSADFKNWLQQEDVKEETIAALEKDGFDSFKSFGRINDSDITDLGVNKGQKRLLENLRHEALKMKEGGLLSCKSPGPKQKKKRKETRVTNIHGSLNAGVIGDVTGHVDNITVGGGEGRSITENQPDSAAGRGEKPNALEAELLRYKAAKKQQQEEAGEEESGPASFTNFGRKKGRALDVGYMMTVFRDVPYSVGMIIHGDEHKGTGFRVGGQYLMTCLHVVSGENGLKVKFNHISGMCLPIIIKDITEVVYYDEAVDVAILKIDGAEELASRPLQLSKYAVDGPLCFFGHPDFGNNMPMMLDTGIKIVHLEQAVKDAPKIREYYQTLLQRCYSHEAPQLVYRNFGFNFQRPTEAAFEGLGDVNFCIIHTAFLPGASGSPGVQVDGSGRVTVGLMLCRGFPAVYHELTDVGRALHPIPSQKFRFEHGLDMSRLYEKMCQWVRDGSEYSAIRKQFLEEIFG